MGRELHPKRAIKSSLPQFPRVQSERLSPPFPPCFQAGGKQRPRLWVLLLLKQANASDSNGINLVSSTPISRGTQEGSRCAGSPLAASQETVIFTPRFL